MLYTQFCIPKYKIIMIAEQRVFSDIIGTSEIPIVYTTADLIISWLLDI